MNVPPSNYKSPLYTTTNLPSIVVYNSLKSKEECGKVYKKDGKWYLSTIYINSGIPIEVFSKYGGFLFLSNLHKQHQ